MLAELAEKTVGNSLSDEEFGFAETFLRKSLFPNGLRRILLVQPPDVDGETINFETIKLGRFSNFPPYGLGILATKLRGRGLEVDILNLQNFVLRAGRKGEARDPVAFRDVWQTALRAKLAEYNPDFVGVSCMFTMTHKSLLEVTKAIREVSPHLPLGVGGIHISNSLANAETRAMLLRDLPSVQLFFTYESDVSFPRFVDMVNGAARVEDLAQLVVRSDDQVVEFKARLAPSGDDLDTIPAHDLLNPVELSQWGKVGAFYCFRQPDVRVSSVLSNRGCRAACTFCSVRNFNGIGVRRRSIESVVEELKILRFEYGVEHVMWLDDDFLYNRTESLKLFEAIIKSGVNMTWDCSNGVLASSISDEVMSAASDSGCIGLFIGMESGNPEVLRQVKKPASVDVLLRAASVLRKFEKVHSRVFLIIGFPGETLSQIGDTINVASEMDLDWCNIQVLQPLPNTPIYDQMIADGLIKRQSTAAVKFTSGQHGKATDARRKLDLLALDFKDAFSLSDLGRVPTREDLDLIWAYMIFHLNYARLFHEQRPAKLVQQVKYLNYILSVIAPNDAMAMYFSALLKHRMGQTVTDAELQRLDETLADSPYWRQRFSDFELSLDHLRTGLFPSGTRSGVVRKAQGEAAVAQL
jgi:radical SAM superfamily enzyme YgiQ (UPF0313 family)